jgi:hypothetical protein
MAGQILNGWQNNPSSYFARRYSEAKKKEDQFAVPLDVCLYGQYRRDSISLCVDTLGRHLCDSIQLRQCGYSNRHSR